MTYSELQINLDLLDKKDKFNFIYRNLPNFTHSQSKIVTVCDEGDCHLFDNDGDEYDINEVKTIREFYNNYKQLINIKIPNGVTNIERYAFRSCINLTNIIIPNNVTSIEYWVFDGCFNLKEIIFQNKTIDEVKSMENYSWGINDESIIKCI